MLKTRAPRVGALSLRVMHLRTLSVTGGSDMPYEDHDDGVDRPEGHPLRRVPRDPAPDAPVTPTGSRRVRRRHPARDPGAGSPRPPEPVLPVTPPTKPITAPVLPVQAHPAFAPDSPALSPAQVTQPHMPYVPQVPPTRPRHRRRFPARALRLLVLLVLAGVGLAWAYTQAPSLLAYSARHGSHTGVMLLAVITLAVLGGLNQALFIKLVGRPSAAVHD